MKKRSLPHGLKGDITRLGGLLGSASDGDPALTSSQRKYVGVGIRQETRDRWGSHHPFLRHTQWRRQPQDLPLGFKGSYHLLRSPHHQCPNAWPSRRQTTIKPQHILNGFTVMAPLVTLIFSTVPSWVACSFIANARCSWITHTASFRLVEALKLQDHLKTPVKTLSEGIKRKVCEGLVSLLVPTAPVLTACLFPSSCALH